MQKVIWCAVLLLSGCSTVNNTVTGNNNCISIEQPKTVTTAPALTTGDNSLPLVP